MMGIKAFLCLKLFFSDTVNQFLQVLILSIISIFNCTNFKILDLNFDLLILLLIYEMR